MERGTGRTTKAMLGAPHNATYVWVNWALDYPRRLASHLGRHDLRIVAPEWLDPGLGYRTDIVVDHAAILTKSQAKALKTLQANSVQ